MAPQTLVAPLVIGPDGSSAWDAGALHGRSRIEQGLQWVTAREQVPSPCSAWLVWVAMELDASNQPVRYKGLSASEILLNPAQGVGYKSVADHVNRISEAVRGQVNASRLDAAARASVSRHLMTLSGALWNDAPPSLRQALEQGRG